MQIYKGTVQCSMHWECITCSFSCWQVYEDNLGTYWQARDAAQGIAQFALSHLPKRVGLGAGAGGSLLCKVWQLS